MTKAGEPHATNALYCILNGQSYHTHASSQLYKHNASHAVCFLRAVTTPTIPTAASHAHTHNHHSPNQLDTQSTCCNQRPTTAAPRTHLREAYVWCDLRYMEFASGEENDVNGAVGRHSARRPNKIVPVVDLSYLKQGQNRSGQRVKVNWTTRSRNKIA